jgi:hypothetical protein
MTMSGQESFQLVTARVELSTGGAVFRSIDGADGRSLLEMK